MALTRRQFLKLAGGSAVSAVVFQACGVPEDELLVQSPLQMPEDLVTGTVNWYATVCRQCSLGEGVVVRVMEGRAKKVEGNTDYPINRGKHSARCEAGLQALYHPDRISAPLVRVGDRGSGQWDEISWPDALERLATQLKGKNPAAVVVATDPVGSHLGTIVERFASTYGARHFSYQPLEEATLRAAIRDVYQQDVMPDFDIENSSYILSFGADFLNTWVSPVRYARGYGQFRQGERSRGRMVHVDSRFSMTGANADEWVYVRPGREGLFALSIAQVIISEGLGDSQAAEVLTSGGTVDLGVFAPERVSNDIGVASDRIYRIANEFAHGDEENRPSLAIGGGSAAAHTNGLFNLTAIYSLNYLVGSVGKPGGVVFNPSPVFDDVPVSPGIASFRDWSDLTREMKAGEIEAMLVRGVDPIYGLPQKLGFREATYDVPLIVSFASHIDDTAAMADLILPENNYLEDWGSDIPDPGPGYQMVGFQQPVVRPLFESPRKHPLHGTRNFPEILMTLSGVMGLDLKLPGETFKDVLVDSARRLFERGDGSIKAPDLKSFWNGVLQRGGWWDTSAQYTGPPPVPPELPSAREDPLFDGTPGGGTFHLIPFVSSAITDGRGAHLPWLQATPDPISTATWRTWVEINLKLAADMGIKEGDVIKVASVNGVIEALAYPNPAVPPEVISVPTGQGHRSGGRYAEGRGDNVFSILSPTTVNGTDSLAWASTTVTIQKTGEWNRLPKFENSAPELSEDKGHKVIQVTSQSS